MNDVDIIKLIGEATSESLDWDTTLISEARWSTPKSAKGALRRYIRRLDQAHNVLEQGVNLDETQLSKFNKSIEGVIEAVKTLSEYDKLNEKIVEKVLGTFSNLAKSTSSKPSVILQKAMVNMKSYADDVNISTEKMSTYNKTADLYAQAVEKSAQGAKEDEDEEEFDEIDDSWVDDEDEDPSIRQMAPELRPEPESEPEIKAKEKQPEEQEEEREQEQEEEKSVKSQRQELAAQLDDAEGSPQKIKRIFQKLAQLRGTGETKTGEAAEAEEVGTGELEVKATPKDPSSRRHQYNPGAKNVAIVKQTDDVALVRVRGKTADGTKAVYKYLTVDNNTLQNVTGDPSLDEENIWEYIWNNYQDNPERFRKAFVADSDAAFRRFEKLTAKGPPKDFEEYVKRTVGETHKEMLLNAIKRRRDPALMNVVSGLSNEQVAKLKEMYGLNKARIKPGAIKQVEKRLKRYYNPTENKHQNNDTIMEVLNYRGRSMHNESSKYIKQYLLYNKLAEMMASDTVKLAQALRKVGADTADFSKELVFSAMQEKDSEQEVESDLTELDDEEGDEEGDDELPQTQEEYEELLNYAREMAQKYPPDEEDQYSSDKEDRKTQRGYFTKQALKRAKKDEPSVTSKDISQSEKALKKQGLGNKFRGWSSAALQKAADWLKPKNEEYARAIMRCISLEEARLDANDNAHAALKIFSKRNKEQYNNLFEQAYDKAIISYYKYGGLLEANDLNKVPSIDNHLFESLIQIAYCTMDPLALNKSDLNTLAESYFKHNI